MAFNYQVRWKCLDIDMTVVATFREIIKANCLPEAIDIWHDRHGDLNIRKTDLHYIITNIMLVPDNGEG